MAQGPRVRVAAPPAEARRLCMRFSRGGIPAAVDDGDSRAEILVVVKPNDLAGVRARARLLVAPGPPGAKYSAAGADAVAMPTQPETLFPRLGFCIRRLDRQAPRERL